MHYISKNRTISYVVDIARTWQWSMGQKGAFCHKSNNIGEPFPPSQTYFIDTADNQIFAFSRQNSRQ